MGVIDWLRGKSPKMVEKLNGSFFYFNDDGIFANKIESFTNANAYVLAKNIAEIYNPIDIISDRVASVNYQLKYTKDDSIVENIPKRIQQLLDRPNALYSMQQLIYNLQFIQLAQGGVDSYVNISEGSPKKSEYINSIWALEPNKTVKQLKVNIPSNPFTIDNLDDLIANYQTFFLRQVDILPENIISNTFNNISLTDLNYISELGGAERNINNLIAVYEARYKAYKTNGAAGILTRKTATNGDMAQFEPSQRKDMIDELNSTDGVTKGKNFIGISAVPMEFIKTLGTISELQPFEETYDDQLKIAGIYNVSKHLLPTKDGTTFTNQSEAEVGIWQNTIKPFAEEMAQYLDRLFYLDGSMYFSPDFDNIEALQTDRKTQLEADNLELDLIGKLRELGINDSEIEKKWKD